MEDNIKSPMAETRKHILDTLDKAQEILTLPSVIQRILEVTSSKNSSVAELKDIIESDPALTTRILSVANSAYYGFVRKVSTISHAVVVLGFEEIKNIALGMSVLKLFDRKGSVFMERLWRHSLAVAVATRMVASHLGLKLEGKYFVGGLLHDIGKIFLYQYMPEVYGVLLTQMLDNDNVYTYHRLETLICGVSHGEIGGRLLNSWGFPPDITDAVKYHHLPGLVVTDKVFAICIHLADILCSIKGITPLDDHFFLPVDRDILDDLYFLKEDFSTDDMVFLLERLDLEIERHSSFVTMFR